MDSECAFCGRAGAANHLMFCQDCQTHHHVCDGCANDTAAECDLLGLELSPLLSASSKPSKFD